MNPLLFLLVGVGAGTLARLCLPDREPGHWGISMVLGVIGAMLGGFVGRIFGVYREEERLGVVVAALGAVVLSAAHRGLRRRDALALPESRFVSRHGVPAGHIATAAAFLGASGQTRGSSARARRSRGVPGMNARGRAGPERGLRLAEGRASCRLSATRRVAMKTIVFIPGGLAVALVAIGCGSTLVPERVAEPRSAIRAATEMGAQSEPRAALHLKLAQDQTERADALLKKGKKNEASWLLLRADADAELALVLTKKEKLTTEAKEAKHKVQDLREKTSSP